MPAGSFAPPVATGPETQIPSTDETWGNRTLRRYCFGDSFSNSAFK